MLAKTITLALLATAGLLTVGCQHNGSSTATPAAAEVAANDKPGSQLWAENCGRCHNIRPPGSFSDTQWDAVVHHMRFRADLTGEEARKIVAFLKASH